MTALAASPSTAGDGLHPPSQSPLRRAKEGRSFPPLPSTASLPADRRGWLRNGARPGDFLAAPRCARARLKHGVYSAATRALMAKARAHLRRMRALLGRSSAAGHGVLRPNSKSHVGVPPCGRPNGGTNGRPHGAAPTPKPAIRVHLRLKPLPPLGMGSFARLRRPARAPAPSACSPAPRRSRHSPLGMGCFVHFPSRASFARTMGQPGRRVVAPMDHGNLPHPSR